MADLLLPSDPVRARRPRRRWRSVALACGTIVLVLFIALLGTLLGPVLRDPTAAYANRQHLARVETQAETRQGSSVVTELRLVADSGLAVELAVRTPDGPLRPRPAVLILGGRATGRDAARLGADVDSVVVAALSYPYAGDPKRPAVWRTRQIQRAVLDTVPATLLATDYLLAQPYVDANRFELVGVSLGAFLVSPAAVLDERIRRLWLVHGAGRPAAVIEVMLRSEVRLEPLRRMLAAFLNVVAGGDYLAAERWVGRMSPRPVVVINARNDERLPPASVEALHAALRTPYRVIWMDGPHVRPDRPEVIDALRALLLRCVVDDGVSGGDAGACPSASSPTPARVR
jgi:dienelactone hydrolase